MQQLSVQDAGFIYQESKTTPMQIGGLGIYDQGSCQHERLSLAETLDYIDSRIHMSKILRQKLMHLKGEWMRPYWVDDLAFDLKNHVQQLELPAPGSQEQLFELVSELMSAQLDMERPLWKVYVIEGLNDIEGLGKNSFAVLTKVHHSCFDGVAASSILAVLNDLGPNDKAPAPPISKPQGKHGVKGHFETLSRDYGKNIIRAFETSQEVSHRIPELARTAFDLYRGRIDSGAKLSVPATRFNKTPSTQRSVVTNEFEMADIKAIKNAFKGTTINDVAVCIISGALRLYLDNHGELGESSLGAAIPKNLRDPKDQGELRGNQVGGMFTSIHNNITDSVDRLYAIHDSMLKAKQFSEEADTALLFPAMMGGFLSPRAGKAVAEIAQQYDFLGNMKPIILNTLITNVPGPNFSLYHAGARMVTFFGMPPLTSGVSLGHAVYSYCNRLTLTVVTCPKVMPDTRFYQQCIDQAFKELMLKIA